MYKAEQAGQQAQGASTGDTGNAEPKNEGDNVEDVDFEEVKED
jgi:molecular chaperone DnaK